MPADFTYDMYATLLDAGLESEIPFITVEEYIETDVLPSRFIVLRHDVDRKTSNAVDFARIEAERGIASTYYFRTADETFDPIAIREINGLGHEVGYHYEDLDRTQGDRMEAHESFQENLGKLREIVPIRTVCMHGNPLTPHDNREMWRTGPTFTDYGLLGEAYLSMDFTAVDYYSDTGRTWRDGALKINDHTVGGDRKTIQIDTTDQLVELLKSIPQGRFCILTHPDRWANSITERFIERSFDTAKNTAKHALGILPLP